MASTVLQTQSAERTAEIAAAVKKEQNNKIARGVVKTAAGGK
jgi:hypothetical protein